MPNPCKDIAFSEGRAGEIEPRKRVQNYYTILRNLWTSLGEAQVRFPMFGFETTIVRVSRAIAKIVNHEAGPAGTQAGSTSLTAGTGFMT